MLASVGLAPHRSLCLFGTPLKESAHLAGSTAMAAASPSEDSTPAASRLLVLTSLPLRRCCRRSFILLCRSESLLGALACLSTAAAHDTVDAAPLGDQEGNAGRYHRAQGGNRSELVHVHPLYSLLYALS